MQAILNAIKNGFYLVDGPVYIADDGANAIFVVPNNPINAAGSAEYPPATAAADIFQSCVDVFFNSADSSIYALDTQFCALLKFSSLSAINAGNATPMLGGSGAGTGPNELSNPLKVIVDGSGNIYVADTANNRIQFMNGATGAWIQLYGPAGAGNNPGGNGVGNYLSSPCSLVVDGSGGIIVADTDNGRLVRVTNASQGAPAATDWQTYSGPPGNAFKYPGSVALDPYGLIYVFDWGVPAFTSVTSTNARLIVMSDMNGTGWEVNASVGTLSPGGATQGRIWVGAARSIYLTQGPYLYIYSDFNSGTGGANPNPAQYKIPGAGGLVGLCVPVHFAR
jgi:hypothetical protein